MCSSSPSPASTQTQVTELPEWARPTAQRILAKGEALTESQAPAVYGGQRYAGLSDLQKQAIGTVSTPEAYQKSLQGFMDPYAQNVIDIQKREANRQSQMAGLGEAAQAVKMGAFGGSRAGLVEAERARNTGQLLSDIQQRGSEAAYQNAQQALQQSLSNKLQFGQLQAEAAQKPLDIAYQDFLNQQNYPYKQLGFLSDIMRGTPTGQSSTISMYQAPPTMGQTIGSLGMGAYGMSQLMRAGGGTVSSYADGGSVEDSRNIEAIVDKLSDTQLKQAAQAAQARGDVEQFQIIQQEMAMRASERSGMAGAFNQLPQEQQEQMMAGGGIVAFSQPTAENNYSLVSSEDDSEGTTDLSQLLATSEGDPNAYKQYNRAMLAHINRMQNAKGYTPMTREQRMAAEKAEYEDLSRFGGENPYAAMKERLDKQESERAGSLAQGRGLAALQAAAAMSQGRGFVQGLGRAGGAFAQSYGQALQADNAEKRYLANAQFNLADAQRKERMGLTKEARANVQAAEVNQYNAIKAARERDAALGSVIGKGLMGTKPLKGSGSGAGKEPKLNEQLAAAEIAHEMNPTEATLARVTALRRAVGQTKDFGPGRAGAAETQSALKLGEAINTAQQKAKFTPEYVKADKAGKEQIMRDVAAQVRQNAAKEQPVNNNSPLGGQNDYSNLWGGSN